MVIDFIRIFLGVVAAYAVAGTLFALLFHWRGIGFLDPATRGSGLVFRIVITPGVIALWPWLGCRWICSRRKSTSPDGRASGLDAMRLRAWHQVSWQVLAVAVPVVIAAALWWRPQRVPGAKLDDFGRDGARSSAGKMAR
jgi:hypothetical protein